MNKIYVLLQHDHHKKHTEVRGACISHENAVVEIAILCKDDPQGEYWVEEVSIIDA